MLEMNNSKSTILKKSKKIIIERLGRKAKTLKSPKWYKKYTAKTPTTDSTSFAHKNKTCIETFEMRLNPHLA